MRYLTTPLLLIVGCTFALAQTARTPIGEKFAAFQEKTSSAKAFLILAQEKFTPGDTVFFTGYFLTDEGKYVAGYQILHVNLLDDLGNTLVRQSVSMKDGIALNQMVLPATLTQGIYRLVAYNDYMKPFGHSFFFRKDIRVVTQTRIEQDVAQGPHSVAVEGGHLIDAMANKIVVVSASGHRPVVISTQRGQQVAFLQTNERGIGQLLLTPSVNEQYIASVDGVSIPLPTVEADGCVLRMLPSVAGSSKFSVDFPENSQWRDQDLVAAVTTNSQLTFAAEFKSKRRGPTLIQLPNPELTGGLSQISIVTPNGTEIAHQSFYLPPRQVVHCEIESSRAEDGRINTTIHLQDDQGNPIEGQFTLSATHLNEGGAAHQTFPSDLNVTTELDYLYRSHSNDAAWLSDLDQFLVAQESRMKWSWILSDTAPTIPAPPKFISAKGRVTFASNHQPVPDSTEVVGYVKNNRHAFSCRTGRDGLFDIAFITLEERDELFFYAERDGELAEPVNIEWLYDSIPLRAPKWKATTIPDPLADFTKKKRAIDLSYNFFASSNKKVDATERRQFDGILEGDLRNTGTTVMIQDYRIFPDMVELLREIIPRLYHRRYGKRDIVRVSFNDGYLQPTSSPLYVIDGVMTKRTDFFLSLSPTDLISIKVVFDPKELSRFGVLGKNGIVIVKTKKGNAGASLAGESVIELNGFSSPVPFPQNSSPATGFRRKPNFRTTMFWTGNARTNARGEATLSFYPTDDLSTIQIRVRGVIGGQYFEALTTLQ